MYYRQKESNCIETAGARIWNGNWCIAYFSHLWSYSAFSSLQRIFSNYSGFVASIIILFLMLNTVIGKSGNYL